MNKLFYGTEEIFSLNDGGEILRTKDDEILLTDGASPDALCFDKHQAKKIRDVIDKWFPKEGKK